MNRSPVIARPASAGRPRPRRFVLWAAISAIATATGGAVLAGPATAASPTTVSFSYTGGTQSWQVPAGVTSATFTLDGASGGSGGGRGTSASGGDGGELVATLAVTPGDTYTVVVGGQGGDNGAAGYNGGGAGGSGGNASTGGGGGGATDVRLGGTGLSNRLLVAGGGGGSSGSGNWDEGADDAASPGGTGSGGTDATAGGSDPQQYGGGGGGAGTGTAGGAGGSYTSGLPSSLGGGFGASGTGGAGGVGYPGGSGGGGGGGYFGGGGGGAANTIWLAGGGGGGGSGHATSSATGVTATAGAHSGDGTVSITYTVGPLPGPTITGTPPDAVAGTAYTPFTFTTTGSPTCSVTSGALPSGLTLDGPTCTLSGTPDANTDGAYPITVTAATRNPPDATDTFTLTVTQPPSPPGPTISGTPADAAVGAPYAAFTFTTTGSPTCAVTSGALPSGLTLDGPTCTLSGTPDANTGGAYPITVTASNGNHPDATDSFTLAVTQAPSLVGTVPGATAGQPYSYQLQLAGYPTPTVAVSPNGVPLPSWLTLDSDGLLHGTAPLEISTTFGIWLDLTNSVTSASYGLNFSVGGVPSQITSGTPSDIAYGQPYTFTFTGTGFPAPSFRVASGQLPYGLTLDRDSGVLSGTTMQLGDFPVTIGVGNGFGTEAQQDYTLHVVGTAPEVLNSPPAAPVNTTYRFTFDTGTSAPAPSFSIASGSLPAGLTLYSNGVIYGYPTAIDPGSPVVIDVSNGVDPDLTLTITIPVVPAPPSLVGTPPTSATVGSPYYYRYTVGGTPVPTLSLTGNPPPGLTIDNYGELQGTPTTPGAYTFAVTATNGATPDASVPLTITVSGVAPTISDNPPASLGQGSSLFFTYALTGQPAPTTAVTDGTLPLGLYLDTSGHLSGAPTTPGVYTFTVTATNGVSPDATTTDTITVAPPAPTISGTPAPATVGHRYSFAFTTTGTPTPTVTKASGALPRGLWLTRSGTLQGIPLRAGTYRFTVRAANGVGTAATELVTMRVLPLTLSIGDGRADQSASANNSSTFTVTLSAPSDLPVSVHWATRNGSAAADDDYSAASGTLTFAPGQTSQTITVSVKPERHAEPPETFVVVLSSPTLATIAHGTAVGSVVSAG